MPNLAKEPAVSGPRKLTDGELDVVAGKIINLPVCPALGAVGKHDRALGRRSIDDVHAPPVALVEMLRVRAVAKAGSPQ